MELTPRKQEVLKAVIKAYIKTGEPIGSKNLMTVLENAPSSATLRNEMSELCNLGLLKQPHTSAGRVPTSSGYRFYVETLMDKSDLETQEKNQIDLALKEINCEPEGIPAKAAQLLSSLTGLPAVSCLITSTVPQIKRIELMLIGRSSAMLLIITSDGRTRSRVFRYTALTERQKECFDALIEKRVKGKSVSELTKAYMQSVVAEAGLMALELMPLLTEVFETVNEIEASQVTLSGENALYNICANEASARKISSLIKSRAPRISILEGIGEDVGAIFGADTSYNELSRETIVAARFSGKDKYKGYLGVIGPNRMSYEHIMSCTKYIAERLNEIMTQAQTDMED